MIDLDELERLRLLAESEQCIDSHHVNDWLEYRVALSEAAPELIAMARRYQWLREHWARVVITTSYAGANVPRSVKLVELGDHILGTVDPDTLDAAIDAAMQEQKL